MTIKNYKCVGLIIKNRSLSVVEVESRKGIPVVTNYAKILLEEGIVENDCVILNKEGFQEAIRKLLVDGVGGPIKTSVIRVSVPEEKIFSHQFSILKEKLNDVEYIKEVAKDFVPIDLNQAVFDYKAVHEDQNGKTITINFVATQERIVQPIIEILGEIGLEVTAINVDIYCLIKSFHNSLNQGEGAFLLVDMEAPRDFLAIVSADDHVFETVSKGAGRDIMGKLKALLNISNEDEIRQLFIATRRGEGFNEEQKRILRNAFKEPLENMVSKIRQLSLAAKAEESIEVKRIYLTGMLSAIPGTEEMLSAAFPNIPIKKNIQFLEVPLEIEEDALEGIGLCLNGYLPDDKNNFNLLPEQRREEIVFGKVRPKIKIFSAIVTLLLIALSVITGTGAARSYLDYKVSSREVIILNEQALNPYITQMARTGQALRQSKEQIKLLIKDSVPVSSVIRNLDSYNNADIGMISIDYKDPGSGENADVSLRAKTASREVTEQLVAALEKNEYFEKVISPLSNLVGKGERFVNISLYANKPKIIELFDKGLAEEENKNLPGQPTTPVQKSPATETPANNTEINQ